MPPDSEPLHKGDTERSLRKCADTCGQGADKAHHEAEGKGESRGTDGRAQRQRGSDDAPL